MKEYTYRIRMEIRVIAEDEYQAEDKVEALLPKGEDVDVDLIYKIDEDEISFEEAVADCWNEERRNNV